jgi:NAD(P)-dependent dehydrogenase (short-subunit alcohol dehydrogenase family)
MQIQGQAAIVTGGASGLGRATVDALIEGGARVAILDADAEAARAAADASGAIATAADVRDTKSLTQALDAIRQQIGTPRICVNCAGIGPAKRIVGRQGSMPLEDFSRVIEINLIGTFNVMRLLAADMAKESPLPSGERGVFINTASVAAYEGQIGQAAYAASKGGVVSLTLPAARELAQHGIRVLAIAPGIFATPMLRALPPEAQRSLAEAIPFPRRLGDPAEFGALAIHMIENPMLNGETVRLDGAIRLAPQ